MLNVSTLRALSAMLRIGNIPNGFDGLLAAAGITGASLVLLSFFVGNEELAVLPITTWFVTSNTDEGEYRFCFVEYGIHFLERAVSCLWEEEVSGREDDKVTVCCMILACDHGTKTNSLINVSKPNEACRTTYMTAKMT